MYSLQYLFTGGSSFEFQADVHQHDSVAEVLRTHRHPSHLWDAAVAAKHYTLYRNAETTSRAILPPCHARHGSTFRMRSTMLPPVETGVVLTTLHWSSVRSIHHYGWRWSVTSGLNGSKDSFMVQAMARSRMIRK